MPKSFLLKRHLRQEWNSREEAYSLAGPLQFGLWDRLPSESGFLELNFQRQNSTFEESTKANDLEKDTNNVDYFDGERDYAGDLAPNQNHKGNELKASRPKDISRTTDEEYTAAEARDKTRSGKNSKKSQHRGYEESRHLRENSSKKLPQSCQPGAMKQPYKCDQCGKIFKTKYTLTIHLKMPSHTGAKPFVCAICGKGFRLSSTLCRHKIIHTSEKPHKCHICDKAFNRSSTLKTHIRTHSEMKEFLCDICGKGFHQKGNLRNHVLIHTGEKPYRCNLCEKAFNKLSNLKFHMHIHTDNAPYRCRYCKICFTRRCDLKLHIADCNHPEPKKEKSSPSGRH
ncbi:hypothetical protein OS493_018958 [Desmophyllum pertusum]|uniref:C2H2-type domain-containing protein n=1 Tax=Desmophyllum pertusum TaxID=174260 RepID=A0A9W9YZN3_9CNID|nr:hypothetical protein OS493_018958 [Desmophyllum pertusum]